MKRELLHLWGPFSINSFGLAIAVGVLVFITMMRRHPRFTQLKLEPVFPSIMMLGIISGLVGGRLLSIISMPTAFESVGQMCSPWLPGFSILGGILGILASVSVYLRYISVPVLPFFDLVSIHAPLTQAISRVGCFFAGCCHGTVTSAAWAVVYQDPQSAAPLNIPIHPSQLYSAAILFGIFALMYFVLQKIYTKPGQLTTIYLMLACAERFVVDFLRDDRVAAPGIFGSILSIDQLVALITATCAGIVFFWITTAGTQRS